MGLYRDSNLNLMLSSPPLPDITIVSQLKQAYKKFVLYSKRDYLNSNSFLVKCFHHDKHNFVIICLISSCFYSKTSRIFNKIIDVCTKARGNVTMNLHTQLTFNISNHRINRLLFDYDFTKCKYVKKSKETEKKDDNNIADIGFELGEIGIDGNQSVFGFLQKDEPPEKLERVILYMNISFI